MRARTLILRRLLCAFLLSTAPIASATGLWDDVKDLRNDEAYRDASAWRRSQVRAFAADIARAASTGIVPASAQRRAEAVGLVLRDQDAWLVMASRPDGADGYYVIRKGGDTPPLLLQAPHAWYDRATGRIACALFEQGVGRALMLNTAHRHSPTQGDGAGSEDELGADVAHRAESIFQAVTLGVADALSDPLVVQLHGFGSSHGSYSAVLSEGATSQPPSQLEAAVRALDAVFVPWGPVATGLDVPELAARSNVQSQALTGQGRFLHLEMSSPARQGLLNDQDLLGRLGKELERLAERAP